MWAPRAPSMLPVGRHVPGPSGGCDGGVDRPGCGFGDDDMTGVESVMAAA